MICICHSLTFWHRHSKTLRFERTFIKLQALLQSLQFYFVLFTNIKLYFWYILYMFYNFIANVILFCYNQ